MIEKEKASDIFEKLRQELRKDSETETIRRLKDEIDLSNIPNGIYFIQIKDEYNRSLIKKLALHK